jgi:thiosulfate/3-mercaptopyruvate sulfurtransferase
MSPTNAGAAALALTTPIESRGYAHPEVLVSTEWVAEHQSDPLVRVLESDEDVLLYQTGHVPGAQKIDWVADLNDQLVRDYLAPEAMQQLAKKLGINRDSIVVFYGDKNNWWATYAFWVFQLFGIGNLRIMDGGRQRWVDEGRPLVTEVPTVPPGNLVVTERKDAAIRALRDDVLMHVRAARKLIDVRSPEEFRGERLHMADYPNEGAVRGGHIPGAKSVPWARAIDPETHTFKSAADLAQIYQKEQELEQGDDVIVYCRIGERSSHTWFVLTYLLGYEQVRNYDGSWTEWGNSVRVPIERP